MVLQADAIADGVVKTLERIYEGDLIGAIQAIGDLASDTIGIRGALNGLGRLGRAIGGGKQGLQKLWQELQACFAAGTPLLTPDGPKNIEDFQPGDLVLSRDEFDPDGPVEPKVVEEVFRRLGRIFHLHVAGQVIRTTAEHPFFVPGRGWVDAGELRIGDRLLGLDGRTMPVEDLLDTGEHETVYNMRVGEWHTYFVGMSGQCFDLWSHNSKAGICLPGTKKAILDDLVEQPSMRVIRPNQLNPADLAKLEAMEAGNGAHRRILERIRRIGGGRGWKVDLPGRRETGIRNPLTGGTVYPDALSPSGRPIEIKPDTLTGRAAGRIKLALYEFLTGHKGRIILYNPSDFK